MKDVRGIVFDLFGTLTDGGVERDRENLYGELARVLGVSREDFSSVMRQTFHERCVGSFGNARQTLARLCAMLGARVDDDTLDAAVRLRLEIERVLATPRGESVALLHTLRDAGFSICLISDCGCETPEIWGSLPFATLIDDPVFSCQVGLRKPHPALYALAAKRLGLEPGMCIYVGDGGSHELSGAEAAGMHAFRLAIPGEDGRDNLRFDPDHAFCGPSIESLSALVHLWTA